MSHTLAKQIPNERVLLTVEGYVPSQDMVLEELCLESTRHFAQKGGGSSLHEHQDIVCSSFSIGTPIVLPLDHLLREQDIPIPIPLLFQMERYHFYWVQLACSFRASEGFRFEKAQFQVQLTTEPLSSHQTPLHETGSAIAYDMFPCQVEDELYRETKLSVSPSLHFTQNPLDVTVTLPLYERAQRFPTYQSRISAFDLQGTHPTWLFTPTPSHGIEGMHRLYLIVRKPKHTHVWSSFHLEAQVHPLSGGLVQSLFMRFKRSTQGAHLTESPTYPLC